MRRYHKPCRFEDPEGNKCRGKAKAHDLCTGHATQQRRGQPLRPLGPWGRPPNEDGRWIDPKGYVFIKCPDPNHPNAKSRRGWIAEHVWVMTQMLGRPLRQGESVHHRNLIKSDNRPENLRLWTSHQPRGTSVADMLAWCRWFISQYSDDPELTAFPGGPLAENGAVSVRDQDGRSA
jgi:HNH endonuclease